MLVGRFLVPLRQLQGYMAGVSKMGFRPFALWSTVGAALWVAAGGGWAFLLAQRMPMTGPWCGNWPPCLPPA